MSRTKDTTIKKNNYAKLLDYMSDPKNPTLTRCQLSTQVLGYVQEHTIYAQFSPDELNEIEWEALRIRRKRYASEMIKVDKGLLKKAIHDGNAAEAKLAYQKFEGWSEKNTLEVGINMEILSVIFAVLPPEYVTLIKEALLANKNKD